VRITGDSSVAEDVVQESLVAVWQSAGRFRGEERVLTWLLSLVYHKALNAVRIQSPVALDEQVDRLAVTALTGVDFQIGAGMFGLAA